MPVPLLPTIREPIGLLLTDHLVSADGAVVLIRPLSETEWIAWPVDPATNELVLAEESRGATSSEAGLGVFRRLGLVDETPWPLSPAELDQLGLELIWTDGVSFECDSSTGDTGMRGALRADGWEAWPADQDSGEGMPEHTGRGPTAYDAVLASIAAMVASLS